MQGGSKTTYDDLGYLPPIRIFTQEECPWILKRLQQDHEVPPMDWHKSMAAHSPQSYALAAHDQILELITTLIGKDVVLWGASLAIREPDRVHPWHSDIESSSPTGRTVSVWIGLSNTNAQSSLKVVPCSHRFGITLQQIMQQNGKKRENVSDEDVTHWARERDDRSGVLSLPSSDGEAVFFDGRLWHGSHNANQDKTRYALLLQYATPDTPIRIPNFQRMSWPFELYQTPKPACILVSGKAMNAPNRIVPAPVRNGAGLPSLTNRVHSLELPLERDPKTGWKPHPLFRGSTPDIQIMNCHVSVLDPGRQPHPPHHHEDEEILMILDGEADLILQDAKETGKVSPHHAQRGTLAYYPAGFLHTIHNTSHAPVTYLMFKWKTDRKTQGTFLPHQLVSFSEAGAGVPGPASKGFSMKTLLNGETENLRHLHAHITSVEPGASYEPHVDAYDVGIVVLEGTVETLGQQVGRHGVIFYAAGEPHGMKNIGAAPARYVVFEFHGRHCENDPPDDALYDPRFSRRLWGVLRDPSRLKKAVSRRYRSLLDRMR